MNFQSPHALMADLLAILRHTVASFVYNHFCEAYPDNFSAMMENLLKANQIAKKAKEENPLVFEQREDFVKGMDIYLVLHLMNNGWSEVFENYPDSMREDARILLDARNAWAHQKEMSIEDVQEIAEVAKRLLREIGTPSAKKATKKIRQLLRKDYYQHIRLPRHHILRTNLLDQVKLELSLSESTVIAFHGMGGIGKSVLARAFCDDKSVQRMFTDGILWMTFGSEVNAHEMIQKLGDWIKALSGKINDIDSSIESLKNRLAELLKDRACLLVLDDVWGKSQFEAFSMGGARCRTIMTTREAEIARDVGAKIMPISVMNETLAIELLEKWSLGKLATALYEVKQTIVNRLGGLPLAVKLAGAQLQTKPPQIWLENFDIRKLKSNRPENIHDSLELTFGLSLDILDTNERKLYAALGIFKEDTYIHESAIAHLWEGLEQFSLDSTQDLLTDLASRALYEVEGDTYPRSIVLHSLLREFMKYELDDIKATHQALISSYQKTQTGAGWHTVPDDGYFYASFVYHLKQADALDTLRQSLFDYPFLQAKLNVTGLAALLMDYDYLTDDPAAKLVQSALIMSGDMLDYMPEQLPVCFYTRLMNASDEYSEISSLLQDCYYSSIPNLFPTTQSSRSAVGVFSHVADDNTLKGWRTQTGEELSEQDLNSLSKQKDILQQFLTSPQILSFFASPREDMQLTDKEVSTPRGPRDTVNLAALKGTTFSSYWEIGRALEHIGAVNSVALSGEYAVSASDDKTLKVWNWQTGEELGIFKGHTSAVLSVTLSDELAESISSENTVKIWNWQTGEELQTRKGQIDAVSSGAVLGNFAISPSDDNTLKVSNWQTGEHITTFYADSHQNAVSIAPDASIIVSGGQNGRVHFLRPNPALRMILLGKS